MVVLEVGNEENIIGRKLSFSFLGVQFEFEVLIVVGVQGRSFRCNRSLSRCQPKKCGWQKNKTAQSKHPPRARLLQFRTLPEEQFDE